MHTCRLWWSRRWWPMTLTTGHQLSTFWRANSLMTLGTMSRKSHPTFLVSVDTSRSRITTIKSILYITVYIFMLHFLVISDRWEWYSRSWSYTDMYISIPWFGFYTSVLPRPGDINAASLRSHAFSTEKAWLREAKQIHALSVVYCTDQPSTVVASSLYQCPNLNKFQGDIHVAPFFVCVAPVAQEGSFIRGAHSSVHSRYTRRRGSRAQSAAKLHATFDPFFCNVWHDAMLREV